MYSRKLLVHTRAVGLLAHLAGGDDAISSSTHALNVLQDDLHSFVADQTFRITCMQVMAHAAKYESEQAKGTVGKAKDSLRLANAYVQTMNVRTPD